MRVPSISSVQRSYTYCCNMAKQSFMTAAAFGFLGTYCFVDKSPLAGSACAALATMAVTKATKFLSKAHDMEKIARKIAVNA